MPAELDSHPGNGAHLRDMREAAPEVWLQYRRRFQRWDAADQ
jgi:hypothetical protein